MKFPSILAASLACALAACSPAPDQASTDAPPPDDAGNLAAESRGHAANVPDAAPSPPGRDPAPDLTTLLAAHSWRLESATAREGTAVAALGGGPDGPLQLDFVDDQVRATNACNALSGAFTLDDAAIAFEPLVGTERACSGPLMAMEREVRVRLSGRHALEHVPGEPPRLRLVDGRGDVLVFTGAPRAGSGG